jgi:hypothetical protein
MPRRGASCGGPSGPWSETGPRGRYVKSGSIAMIFDHRLVLRVPSALGQELPARPRRRRRRAA